MSLSNELKRLRIQLGLSQEEVGKEIGFTQQQISLYENGTLVPKVKDLVRLSTVLRADISELIKHAGEK